MPLKRKNLAAPEEKQEGGFGLRNLLAGGVRAVSGFAAGVPSAVPGIGSAIGAGIAGLGEGAAQMIEEGDVNAPFDQESAKRIAAEAALGAVPLGKFLKAGSFVGSALRGGAFAGAGEALREASRDQELDPASIGIAAGTGGLLTGAIGKFLGPSKPATAPKPTYEVVPTSQTGPGTSTLQEGGRRTSAVYAPQAITGTADPSDFTAAKTAVQSQMDEQAAQEAFLGKAPQRVPLMGSEVQPSAGLKRKFAQDARTAEQASKAATAEIMRDQKNLAQVEKWAAKQAEEKAARTAIQTGKAGKEATETVTETFAAPKQGVAGTEKLSRVFKTPKADGDEGGEGAWEEIGDALGVTAARVAPEAPIDPARAEHAKQLIKNALAEQEAAPAVPAVAPSVEEAFQAASPLAKMVGAKGARKPRTPKSAAAFNKAVQGALPEAPAAPTSPEVPLVGPTPLAEVSGAPTAPRFKYHDPITKEPTFDLEGSDVSLSELQRRGIPVPENIPAGDDAGFMAAREAAIARQKAFEARPQETPEDQLDAWMRRPDAPAAPTEAPEGELAQFFKGPVDAVGQAKRLADADVTANPIAQRQLGVALQQEAAQAGLPVGKGYKPTNLGKFLGSRVSPAIQQEYAEGPARTIDDLAEAMAQPKPAAPELPPGVAPAATEETPDWVKEQLSFIDRIKNLGSSESGEVGTGALVRGALGAGGALIGAATDPFDNPILSAAAGAVAGAALPSAGNVLRSMGVPGNISGIADNGAVNTEQASQLAKQAFRYLPHMQRFNLLMSAEGLAANAIAGPYGSAVMASLEKGLAGDARGWEALRQLSPQNFLKEFYNSSDEAIQLIKRGYLEGRYDVAGLPQEFGTFESILSGSLNSKSNARETHCPLLTDVG